MICDVTIRSKRWLGIAACLMMMGGAVLVGCVPDPTEVDPEDLFGCNDLELTPLSVYEGAGGAADDDNVLEANEPILVKWLTWYHKGHSTGLSGSGPFRGSVSIEEDGIEVFYVEFDAEPIGLSGGEWGDFQVDVGLPAGTYTVRVVMDIDHAVEECSDLPFQLNNVKELEFVVEHEPIDDVANPTSEGPGRGDPPRG